MPIEQRFFELRDVPPLQGRPWITLRHDADIPIEATDSSILELREYTGIATAAIFDIHKSDGERITWSELGVGAHRGGMETWGYRAADLFFCSDQQIGINLVIDQYLEDENLHIWHLHPDLLVALRLCREGDSWFRPEEGWTEVARLKRNTEARPMLIEIRAEFLSDYLSARSMALYCSSYRQRNAVTVDEPFYSWPDATFAEVIGRDERDGWVRTGRWPVPNDQYQTMGALWRTEWVKPSGLSTRTRGDKDPHLVSFALESDGTRKQGDALDGVSTWLYFNAAVVPTLLRHRGASLSWYSAETGSVGASTSVHFGVNRLGLLTVFAKDIGALAPWEQRLWSAHNVIPEGGVADELFAAQMEVTPASTVAPESQLVAAFGDIDAAFSAQYGTKLLREDESVPNLLRRAHRFQATEVDGLLELSKELTRLFTERIDIDAVLAPLNLPKSKDGKRLGSNKALEKLLSSLLPEADARAIMAPLFGIYDLRLADAHLGWGNVASGKLRAGIDATAPAAMQGRQLLDTFVATLRQIAAAIAEPPFAQSYSVKID
jgi:hypothetical protein